MNKLISELQRLYFIDDQQWHQQTFDDSGNPVYLAQGKITPAIVAQSLAGEMAVALDLVSRDATARAMLVCFEQASDWERAAKLYQGVQDDLDLPAPAVSVSGRKGYRLWFSIAEPLPVAEVRRFLDALRCKYLADIPVKSLAYRPDVDSVEPDLIELAPALNMANEKWSAYIDPSMGGMFVDGPWLEMAPNMDRQADILAGLESIKPADLQRALSILERPVELDIKTAPSSMEDVNEFPGEPTRRASNGGLGRLSVGSDYTDPRKFLLAVMNDPAASARQRIKAARALLPYLSGITSG